MASQQLQQHLSVRPNEKNKCKLPPYSQTKCSRFSLLSVTFESDPGNEQQVEAEEITESPSRSEAGESGLCFLHVRIKVILGTKCCLYSNSSTFSSLTVQI